MYVATSWVPHSGEISGRSLAGAPVDLWRDLWAATQSKQEECLTIFAVTANHVLLIGCFAGAWDGVIKHGGRG